jgi:voltage-gated sodium channel
MRRSSPEHGAMPQIAILASIYRSRAWRVFVGAAILANALVLGAVVETPEGSAQALWLERADKGLLALLVADVALCLLVKRRKILSSGWDLFDVAVTLASIVPNVGFLSAFRTLRVIRVLRLVSFLPHGRATVDALLKALRDMTAAFLVLAVVFYSFVVIATNMFRDVDPMRYGTLARSAAHLFSVMVSLGSNLENETIFGPLPWAVPLFGAFIVVASFGLLNMFIAVIVAALKEELDREHVREERARFDRLERKLEQVAAGLEALARGGAVAKSADFALPPRDAAE